jgi:hypothetical protein
MHGTSQAVANELAVGQFLVIASAVVFVALLLLTIAGAVGRAYPFLFLGTGALTFAASGVLYFTPTYPFYLATTLAPYEQYWTECLGATLVFGAIFVVTLWHVDRTPGGPHNY